jgi:C1A family cysteine protease
MPTTLKVRELRQLLAKSNAKWTVDERLNDDDLLPRHATGGDLTKFVKVTAVPRIDVTPHFKTVTSNPFLLQLRMDKGFLRLEDLPIELRHPIDIHGPATTTHPPVKHTFTATAGVPTGSSVDWRNRFGWPWLTKIKDQGPCESCWVFSAVGVVEAMTRIEHTIWSLRSEGDVHDGMGAKCATTGWPTGAFDWMKQHGVADPGCWPYETQNLAYKPTADRNGRTVKLSDYETLSNIDDQKAWIENVGPLSACFTCYNDFFGYGPNSGVYTANIASGVAGGHCIVIVGYDDSRQAWLVRNSWSTGWGMAGYCWFGYGQADIDNNAKYAVPGGNVNPDPWTKRRAHNGSLYESGDGQLHRNFELWTLAPGNAIRHYWRDGVSLQWNVAETQGNDCFASPCVQGTTYNRNFELVYETTSEGASGCRLHHRYYDQASAKWGDGGLFGPSSPNDVEGLAGFIQGDYNAPGNFEVVVRTADRALQHWWRDNGAGGPQTWAESAAFGSNVAFSAAALVQRFDNGLDVICTTPNGTMQRYWRDDPNHKAWQACETFGSQVKSPPVMIEGQYGATDETVAGNYELCVAVNGAIQHWYKVSPENPASKWAMSTTFGQNVQQVLGLIQSSFGFDLELIALLNDGALQHFWRYSSDLSWHAGPVFGSTVK